MSTEKFESLCRQFKIDPVSQDGDLANVFFNLGIKYALKEQTSVPSLFLPNDQEIDFEVIPVDGLDNFYTDTDPRDLTQADFQSLSSMLNKILNSFEDHFKVMDRNINALWEVCDVNQKDDVIVSSYFRALNDWKNSRRDLKEKYKQIAKIQSKLKFLMKFA